MGTLKRIWWVMQEPRYKFYVKEGRAYTVPTGVPGVWDDVAKAIMRQTVESAEKAEKTTQKGVRGVRGARTGTRRKAAETKRMEVEMEKREMERKERLARFKRQTTRGGGD
jgi:hypothetical protein